MGKTNEYIAEINLWPATMSSNKTIRVISELTKEELSEKLQKIEEDKNPMYEVFITVYTVEEYLSFLETVHI